MNKSYIKAKREGENFRERKTLKVLDNGRSADYIIPNFATGCNVYCSYCYVARNQPYGNPLTIYNNTERIIESVIKHHSKLPAKISNQCDSLKWTYDIGEATDCLNYQLIDKTNLIISKLTEQDIKPTFATKLGNIPNINKLVSVEPNSARIRMSLMPQPLSSILEVGSSKILDRLKGVEAALNKGYEVHLNFSPIIVYANWIVEYDKLMTLINETLSDQAKSQLKCEVIFLTHEEKLHIENLTVNPEVEKFLHTSYNQEAKVNNRGSNVIRYNRFYKSIFINQFRELLEELMPYCSIRYIF